MSLAGGGSGVSGGSEAQSFRVLEGANVQLPSGVQVDLSTVEGVAEAEATLTDEQVAELEGLMRGIGFKRQGATFVPSDDFELRRELGIVGPSSTTEGISEADQELAEKVFGKLGLALPPNANTTYKLEAELKDVPAFNEAVSAFNNQIANPTNANSAEFITRMNALLAQFPEGNIMEVLFLVFRESIKETNEDKKYFLLKLQEFNKMAEHISEYLSYLVDKSQELSEKAEGKEYPDKVHINVESKSFDLTTLDPNGNLKAAPAEPQKSGFESYNSFDEYWAANQQKYRVNSGGYYGSSTSMYNETKARSDYQAGKAKQAEYEADAVDGSVNKRMNRTSLNDTIKRVESMQETVRNKRQMASTAFQNFDQKANQLYNLMASVLKTLNEMRSGTIRNML